MARTPQRARHRSTVDAAEVERFSRAGRRMVGSARQDGAAAQVQSGAARLYPRPGGRALRPRSEAARLPEGPAHPRHRLRRRHPVGAAGPARRRGGRRRSGRRPTSRRRRRTPTQAGLAIDYRCTTAEELADAGERFDVVLAMEVVEHVADVPLFVAELRRDGEARRADDRRHPQPHAEELRARHRRRRIYPALAAARHASAGTSSSRRTSWRSRWSRAACASSASSGVIYNLVRRPLAASSDMDVNYMLVAERA